MNRAAEHMAQPRSRFGRKWTNHFDASPSSPATRRHAPGAKPPRAKPGSAMDEHDLAGLAFARGQEASPSDLVEPNSLRPGMRISIGSQAVSETATAQRLDNPRGQRHHVRHESRCRNP